MAAADMSKKRADLWGKTIVSAFRDLQWKKNPSGVSAPPTNVELGGNIERAFGDSLALANSRVLLLEMKSTFSRIKDEWKGGEKLALASLRKKVANDQIKFRSISSMLHRSFRAHHFLYWSEDASSFGPDVWPGALVVSPYIYRINIDLFSGAFPLLDDMMSSSSLAIFGQDNVVDATVEVMFADRIFSDKAGVLSWMHTEKDGSMSLVRYPLGLTPLEMREYLQWLLSEQNEKDLPINALLASVDGNLCRHVSHISDVELILEAMLSNDASMNLKAEKRIEKERWEGVDVGPVMDQKDYETSADPVVRNVLVL